MPHALASVPFSSTEILSLIQIQGNQWKNSDGKFKNTASLVSFESEPTFRTSLELEGLSKTVADHKVYIGLWLNYVLAVTSRSSTSTLTGSEQYQGLLFSLSPGKCFKDAAPDRTRYFVTPSLVLIVHCTDKNGQGSGYSISWLSTALSIH